MIPTELLRMVDANLDRASEGLRVAEDIARFVLDDSLACQRLRSMRHRLWEAAAQIPGAEGRLLAARESGADVGRKARPRRRPGGTASMLRANLHRAEEALRTIEECLGSFGLDPSAAAEIRFQAYDCEKELYPRLARRDQEAQLLSPLCMIIGARVSGAGDTAGPAAAAIEGGAGAIQLRPEGTTARELLGAARELRRLTSEREVTLIVEDRVDVALVSEADGIHLGADGVPPAEARRITGPDMILGVSVRSQEEARRAEEEGAAYVSVGPGRRLIAEVRAAVGCGVTGTGGINPSNVAEVIRAGADRVAVEAIGTAAQSIRELARALADGIQAAKEQGEKGSSQQETNDALVP